MKRQPGSTKERGYTQEQLAELTKLSTRHIAGIENGGANPSFDVLCTITSVLGALFGAIFDPADEQAEREIQEIAGFTGPARNMGGS